MFTYMVHQMLYNSYVIYHFNITAAFTKRLFPNYSLHCKFACRREYNTFSAISINVYRIRLCF